MSRMSMSEVAAKIKKIDFCMMSTKGASDEISNRPMSNNGDVDYDGDSWFFSYDDTRKISDIARDATVALSFAEPPGLLGKPGVFLSIEGQAVVLRDRQEFERHWMKDLERWFPDGVETPGLILIKIRAKFIRYWDGEENGTIEMQ